MTAHNLSVLQQPLKMQGIDRVNIRFQIVFRTQLISVVQDLLGLAAQDIRINQGTSPIFVPGDHPEFDENTLHRHS